MNKIILLGYMGSGKSTVGESLAKNTHLSFLDLDQLIKKEEGDAVKTIFEKKGELYFRKLEHKILVQLMTSSESFVLSLGGGTPCYGNNSELLNGENITSIYLKASIEELYSRLIKDKINRPLIASLESEKLKEYIAKQLFERSFFYNKAKYIVNIDGKSIEDIILEIREKLI